MSNVFKSVKLDNYILKGYYKAFLGIYIIAIALALIAKNPALTVAVVMVISAPIVGLFFSVYEKNNLSKLYGILPIARSQVVVGRFLYALSLSIINGIVSGALAYVISLLSGYSLDHLTFIAVLSASFAYFCLFIAIIFPIDFKYPFSRVYIFSNLPLYILAVIGALVLRKTDLIKNMGQIIQYFTSNQEMIWITGFGLGLILLAVSCSLSSLIYKKREL
jgi:hypothetical protein